MSIWWNGVSSDDVNVKVQYYPNEYSPSKKYTPVSVPGRNGDLVFEEGAFQNVTRSYTVYANGEHCNFPRLLRAVNAWLLAPKGYCKLADSYNPDIFYMATFVGGTDWENKFNRLGVADIEFNCKPQKFLASGEDQRDITATATVIENPTPFVAKPLMEVSCTGSGTITFGGKTLTLSSTTGTFTVDCEIGEVYTSTQNLNGKASGSFPELVPGANTIAFTGDITEIVLTPRWWTL